MSRPVEIETLQKQLAEVTRKLAKLESQRAESFDRRKRTRELIQLGATARKIVPNIGEAELERALIFMEETFFRTKNQNNIDIYQNWKKRYLGIK